MTNAIFLGQGSHQMGQDLRQRDKPHKSAKNREAVQHENLHRAGQKLGTISGSVPVRKQTSTGHGQGR
jgi:hypothetical protein